MIPFRLEMPNPSYILVNQVGESLKEIYLYTHESFGQYQADAYAAGFVSAFELLAKFPKMGQSADEYKQGLRRYRYKSHLVFYSIADDHVLIEFVSHVRVDVRKHMFDED